MQNKITTLTSSVLIYNIKREEYLDLITLAFQIVQKVWLGYIFETLITVINAKIYYGNFIGN